MAFSKIIAHRFIAVSTLLLFVATLAFEFMAEGSSATIWKTLAIIGCAMVVIEAAVVCQTLFIKSDGILELAILQVICVLLGVFHIFDAFFRAGVTAVDIMSSYTITINSVYGLVIVLMFVKAFTA